MAAIAEDNWIEANINRLPQKQCMNKGTGVTTGKLKLKVQ